MKRSVIRPFSAATVAAECGEMITFGRSHNGDPAGSGSVLVNISRGPVVDEEALVSALRTGQLGGACLDVFATEPLPAGSPLWDLPNVIISPHSAATVAAENGLITDLFIDNIRRWMAGRPLRNLYDRAVGY